MIGGYFKFHWIDPQLITVKIDDPKSPLTAMFHGQAFEIHDETYTFAQDSFSRENVHVLTSIDYAKMSDADKAKEPAPRAHRPRLRPELDPPRRARAASSTRPTATTRRTTRSSRCSSTCSQACSTRWAI